MRPSMEVASFSATKGCSVWRRVARKGALTAAASSARSPTLVSMPTLFNTSMPPRASGSGSRTAATTRRIPAARIAAVHGGVFPVCAQGSRVTTSVAPRACSPAARSAFTSAWGPPNSAWNPSATLAPPWRMTAPTRGLGATRPQPRQAMSNARRIAPRSDACSEVDAKTRAPEDMPRLRIEIRERGGETLVRPGLVPELRDELHETHRQTRVGKQDLARVGQIEVGGEVGRVPTRDVAELDARHVALHDAHRHAGNRKRPLQETDPRAVAEAQRDVADLRGARVHRHAPHPAGRQQHGTGEAVDRQQPTALTTVQS